MATVNQFNSDEKILSYTDKLDYHFNGGKTLIITELDLTNQCNNHCPECVGIKENGAELSWDSVRRIVLGLKEIGNQGIIISGGGEPLLSPHFIDTLELIRVSGMKVGLNSNGLALDEEKARAVGKYCEYFRVSLDAGSPAMYRQTHGMPEVCFEKVIANIKMMSDVKKAQGSRVSFGTGFLTGAKTLGDMENFVKLSKECRVDFAQFRPFSGDYTDIESIYNALKDKYEDDSFTIRASSHKYKFFGEDERRPYTKCRGMFFSTVITADAKMFACIHHRQKDKYFLGSIKEKTIPEIWASSRKWQVFENIDFDDCPLFCRNDSFNRTLADLEKNVPHREFL